MTREHRRRPLRAAPGFVHSPAATGSKGSDVQREAVVFANEAFYAAFASGDAAAMEGVWAKDVPVACIHPGWAPLTTREEVMASWRGILEGLAAPAIQFTLAGTFVYDGFAFVVCYEQLGENVLVATNIFLLQAGTWKMIHHQAGPTVARPGSAEVEPVARVH